MEQGLIRVLRIWEIRVLSSLEGVREGRYGIYTGACGLKGFRV